MGGAEGKPINALNNININDYQPVPGKAGDDSRFGQIKIFKNKNNGHLVLQKTKICQDERERDAYITQIKRRQTVDHKNVFRVYGYNIINQSEMCGEFYQVNLYADFFDIDLESEIRKRAGLTKPTTQAPVQPPKAGQPPANQPAAQPQPGQLKKFSEPELWYIIDSAAAGLQYLQSQNIVHGDIRPATIFINNEGQAKIGDNVLLSGGRTALQRAMSGQGKPFLSPILMQSVAAKNPQPKHDPYKSDVYSLGMTLLYAANLSNPEKCYRWTGTNIGIDENAVRAELNKVSQSYSRTLHDTIEKMLRIQESERPDFNTLRSLLAPIKAQVDQGRAPQDIHYDPLGTFIADQAMGTNRYAGLVGPAPNQGQPVLVAPVSPPVPLGPQPVGVNHQPSLPLIQSVTPGGQPIVQAPPVIAQPVVAQPGLPLQRSVLPPPQPQLVQAPAPQFQPQPTLQSQNSYPQAAYDPYGYDDYNYGAPANNAAPAPAAYDPYNSYEDPYNSYNPNAWNPTQSYAPAPATNYGQPANTWAQPANNYAQPANNYGQPAGRPAAYDPYNY